MNQPTVLLLLLVTAMVTPNTRAGERIDLVEDARVVRYEGDSPETLEVRELKRGLDGWETWQTPDGEYAIGVEWDEPRDIAEVNIEFRHAIAERDKIRVQYWQNHWPNTHAGGWAPVDDPFHGHWVTAKGEWWAGDRDVSIAFSPYNEERPGDNAPAMAWRRTYRLRFLAGGRELPPVRYIRAYGPHEPAEAIFDLGFEADGAVTPPVMVSVINGAILGGDGDTTMSTARLEVGRTELNVRYADGDVTSATRTIVTVREVRDPLQGFSFLPAEVVKQGRISIPALQATVAHRGSQIDAAADRAPGRSVYDRVATEPEQTFERARREIPAPKKTQQSPRPLYLPLGVPDARQEIAVNYDGSILLDKNALKVPAEDSKRLRWPADAWMIRLTTGDPAFDHRAEGNVKQQLLEGWLPIVINTWEHQGIAFEQTCVAGLLDEEHRELVGDETVVLMVRLRMRNTSDKPMDAVVRLTPEPREALEMEGSHVLATGRIQEDGRLDGYGAAAYRFHANAVQGEARLVSSTEGGPTDTLVYRHPLAAGNAAEIVIAVPFVTLDRAEEHARIASLDFDTVLDHEVMRWRRIIGNAAGIETPEPLLNDFYKAQLAHILITADRDPHNGTRVLPAATYDYGVCVNESCHQIRALEIRGLHRQAEMFLQAMLDGQSTRGLHGRFNDAKGVLHGLPSNGDDYQKFNYNLDHGFALWMLNEHYRFTRDTEWLDRVAPQLIAACDFVTRAADVSEEANTLAGDDERWGIGLLPPGHLEDPPEWLWWFAVNAYAWRGMAATGESLREISHPEARRIAAEAATFGRRLQASCREAMVRAPVVRLHDGTYVPFQPTRSRLRGRDTGWIRDALYGPIHLIDCGVYADDSPEAEWILRDAEDNVFIGAARGRAVEDFATQWFSWGGITLQSNLLPNPLVYLRRSQPGYAIRAFYNSFAANLYADVRTFCEHPINAYGWGAGPFFKSPDESAFIVWLRHLLAMEEGRNLELLAGAPLDWLEPGKSIRLTAAPTWFGEIDLEVVSQADPRRVAIELFGPTRNPPERIRLHLRPTPRPRRIDVNGEPARSFDAATGVLELEGDISHARIVAEY